MEILGSSIHFQLLLLVPIPVLLTILYIQLEQTQVSHKLILESKT